MAVLHKVTNATARILLVYRVVEVSFTNMIKNVKSQTGRISVHRSSSHSAFSVWMTMAVSDLHIGNVDVYPFGGQ